MYEHSKQGAVHLIRFTAPINQDNADHVVVAIDSCLDHGQPQVVISLERVPLVDSKGLELLVEYQQHCIALGGCIKLAVPGELCRDILVATDVASQFELFDDELTAIGSFAQ